RCARRSGQGRSARRRRPAPRRQRRGRGWMERTGTCGGLVAGRGPPRQRDELDGRPAGPHLCSMDAIRAAIAVSFATFAGLAACDRASDEATPSEVTQRIRTFAEERCETEPSPAVFGAGYMRIA